MIDEIKPPRIPSNIKRPPRIREIYWCNFWQDAQLPEMWKRRPVVIISPKNSLDEAVSVLPLTTKKQKDNVYVHKLDTPLINKQSWVLCHYPQTVACSRLSPFANATTRLSPAEFLEIQIKFRFWLKI